MTSNAFPRQAGKAETRGFSRTDLVAVIGVVVLLSLVFLPALARENDDPERAVCLKNMQQIMAAVAMYSTDNNDFLPHPSWGGNLTGPDNWCYATVNRGRDPELPVNATATSLADCTGRSERSIQFSNQLRFFKIGQLARFLESQRGLICPTDWRESMSGKSFQYIGRPLKLTSYSMSGVVVGYPRQGLQPSGKTYKTSDFLPTDILLWEENEISPPGTPPGFTFNDAASNPETSGEGLSRRHTVANGEGMGVVGRSGALADFVKWGTFNTFLIKPRPNDLLCGPGYQ